MSDPADHGEWAVTLGLTAAVFALFALGFGVVAVWMCRRIPIFPVLRDAVVPPRRSHSPASLMFEGGVPKGQGFPAERAAATLTL